MALELTVLGILGLTMNFIGAILIFVYGVYGGGENIDQQQVFRAGIGVALLIIGFFLQLVQQVLTAYLAG